MLGLATNAGRDVKKRTGSCLLFKGSATLKDSWVWLMAKMTPYQLKLAPTDWKPEDMVYQKLGEVVEEWHTVVLYV